MLLNNLILTIFFFWLLVLTLYFLKLRQHYYYLTSKTQKDTLDEILEKILKEDEEFKKEIDFLKNELNKLINSSRYHFQKYGLVRFNPFDRSGGDQSFVIAFLDEKDNGLTVNFIYTKEGLRVYTKEIREGRGVNFELSEEEKEAIKKSRKNLVKID